MSKPRIVKDYENLSDNVKEQIKLENPRGFDKKLITFKDSKGKYVSALPFEGEDYYYLIRMTRNEAQEIVADDDDYDDNGRLKDGVVEELTEKFEVEEEDE